MIYKWHVGLCPYVTYNWHVKEAIGEHTLIVTAEAQKSVMWPHSGHVTGTFITLTEERWFSWNLATVLYWNLNYKICICLKFGFYQAVSSNAISQ